MKREATSTGSTADQHAHLEQLAAETAEILAEHNDCTADPGDPAPALDQGRLLSHIAELQSALDRHRSNRAGARYAHAVLTESDHSGPVSVYTGSCSDGVEREFVRLDQIAKLPERDTRPAVATAPERIYLQISDDESHYGQPFPGEYAGAVTWCGESVLLCEVPYVRADIVATFPSVPPAPEDADAPFEDMDPRQADALRAAFMRDNPEIRIQHWKGEFTTFLRCEVIAGPFSSWNEAVDAARADHGQRPINEQTRPTGSSATQAEQGGDDADR